MQAPNSVIDGSKDKVVSISSSDRIEKLNSILYKGIGSDGTLYHRDTNTVTIEVFKIKAGVSKILISGIDIYSTRYSPNDDSQEIKYFYHKDDASGKIHTRDKWIVAALCSSLSANKLNLISDDYRINVDTYNALEMEYIRNHKFCACSCEQCGGISKCIDEYKNDIVVEMNIDQKVFEQNNEVYLHVCVSRSANLCVKEYDDEIKRIDELDFVSEDLEYYHTISGCAFNGDGTLYENAIDGNDNVKIDVFKVKKGVGKIVIFNIDIYTKGDSGAAHEIKWHPKRGKWPVAALHCGKDPKEITNGSLTLIDGNRLTVEEYNKCEEWKSINPVEMSIDDDVFEKYANQDIYLMICTSKKSQRPNAMAIFYKKANALYFKEEPVAEAITDGDTLEESRIFFGSVVKNGVCIEKGICLWENPKTSVADNGMDYQEFKAVFYKPLRPVTLAEDVKFFRNVKNFEVSRKREFKKRLTRYKRVGWFVLPVPVYAKSNHRFDTFVWEKNHHSEPFVLEPEIIGNRGAYTRRNLLRYTSHHRYKDVLESFSLLNIYKSYESIAQMSPESVAKIIVRNIARQPKGFRSISFDQDVLKDFFGGPIRIADNISLVDTQKKEGDEKVEAERDNKIRRAQKDYLYSMVYFGEDDTAPEDKLCGDGYFFYDAPIHVDNPKIKTKPVGIEGYISGIKALYCNSNVHKDGEDVNKSISSCEAFCNLMDKIFKIVKGYGFAIDYVFHDFEIMHNTSHEMRNDRRVELSNVEILNGIPYFPDNYRSMKNALWCSLKEVSKKVDSDSYQNIYNKLCERGYAVLDENNPLDDAFMTGAAYYYGYLSYGIGTSEKHCDHAYVRRRNLNIWDQVAKEYVATVFDKFMMEPIRKYSPEMRCSMWFSDEQKGFCHVAPEFESYLGGNVQLPPKMGSTPIMYGSKSVGIYKHNLYNWKTLPCASSPFDSLACTINLTRSAKISNPLKPVMPFISCSDYWTMFACGANDADYAMRCHKYYREMLFHAWLCNPQMMYAYIVYSGFYDKGCKMFKLSDDKKSSSETFVKADEYYQGAYQNIQDIVQELKSLIGASGKLKLVTKTLASETDPFVITCARVGKIYLYRLSFNDEYEIQYSKRHFIRNTIKMFRYRKNPRWPRRVLRDVEFKIHGKTICFANAVILRTSCKYEKEPGFWIVSRNGRAPLIKTDSKYYLDNPSWTIDDFEKVNLEDAKEVQTIVTKKDTKGEKDVLRLLKSNLVTVFGEPAKCQKIFATLGFDTESGAKTILHEYIDDKRFAVHKEYTFERMLDFYKIDFVGEGNSSGCVLHSPLICLDNGYENKDAALSVYMDCHGNPLWSKPLDYLDIFRGEADPEKFSETVKTAKFKSCIQGMNFRVDLFRERDGVNVTEIEKYYSEEEKVKMRSLVSDRFFVKVSWLNATSRDEKYRVICRPYSKCRIFCKPLERTFYIAAGDEGYRLYRYGNFPSVIQGLNVFVEHDGTETLVSNVVFNSEKYLKCVKTIESYGIGSVGTLHNQETSKIKIDVFKIPAGKTKISISGIDVYSVNNDPNCINSQEIKYHPKRTKWIVATLCSNDDVSSGTLNLIPNHRINVEDFLEAEKRGVKTMTMEIDNEVSQRDSYLFVCVAKTADLRVELD